jgi:Icc-related predicted phosphoesterase
VIRVAAVGDVHFGADSAGTLRPFFEQLPSQADLFLIAGDATRHGDPSEARVLAQELDDIDVTKIAVLGNHDYHSDAQEEIRRILEGSGVQVLEGSSTVVEVNGARIGIAGTKGFGGGFAGACGSDFGEPEMKAFVRHTKGMARRLEEVLRGLEGEVRLALLHYSPIEATLRGERLEIYPFLGSYLLAEAIDRAQADLAIHGHAHGGSEKGATPGGVTVRNVALPVIKHPYNIYCCEPRPRESR